MGFIRSAAIALIVAPSKHGRLLLEIGIGRRSSDATNRVRRDIVGSANSSRHSLCALMYEVAMVRR
jgi:hypothetical protein